MTIATVCKKNIVYVSPDSSVHDAAKQMKQHNTGDVLVEVNGKVLGILTDRDIVIKLAAEEVELGRVKVSDLMSENVLTLKSSLNIMEAIEALSAKGVRRAPVVDDSGRVCGILSVDDLLVLLINDLQKISEILQAQMHTR